MAELRDRRSILRIKAESAARKLAIRWLPSACGLVLVTEYPKSGGTWLSQLLAHATGLRHSRRGYPELSRAIMQLHVTWHPCYTGRAVVIHRDGRDVICSFYHHLFFLTRRNHPGLVQRYRKRAGFRDFDNMSENLPAFIEMLGTQRFPAATRLPWAAFVDTFASAPASVPQITYEGLVADTAGTLSQVILALTGRPAEPERVAAAVAAYDFETQRAAETAAAATEGTAALPSFLRRGKPGDWRDHFTRAAGEVMDRLHGATLMRLGYVSDRDWWTSLPQSR